MEYLSYSPRSITFVLKYLFEKVKCDAMTWGANNENQGRLLQLSEQ